METSLAVNPDYLVVAFLMISSPSMGENTVAVDEWHNIAPACQKVAIDLEIMSDYDKLFTFKDYKDFDEDLRRIRNRYQAYKDAPPLSDIQRLPDNATARAAYHFNLEYKSNLRRRLEYETDKAHHITQAIRETDELRLPWDIICDCTSQWTSVSEKRRLLQKLKDLIGEENYSTMTLPPCVPIWRFEEVEYVRYPRK